MLSQEQLDAVTSITRLCGKTASEHGWDDPTIHPGENVARRSSPVEQIALIHSEATEMLECLRDHEDITHTWFREKDGKPEGVVVEAVDVLVRVLHFCDFYGLDVAYWLDRKMEFNESRPMRHGGKNL